MYLFRIEVIHKIDQSEHENYFQKILDKLGIVQVVLNRIDQKENKIMALSQEALTELGRINAVTTNISEDIDELIAKLEQGGAEPAELVPALKAIADTLDGVAAKYPKPAASTAPSGVNAVSDGAGNATISWEPVSGASAYNVYMGTETGVTKASGTAQSNVNSPYVWAGLTTGTSYYFVVTAMTPAGESVESIQVSV